LNQPAAPDPGFGQGLTVHLFLAARQSDFAVAGHPFVVHHFLNPQPWKNVRLTIQFLAALFALTTGLLADSTGCATTDRVTLQLKWVPQAQFAGYYAAQHLGHYKDECLEVTIRPGGLQVEPEEVVGKGEAQFGIAWQAGMLAARDRGMPLVAIAQVFQYSGMRLLSWKEADIRSASDLKGKKVAVWLGGNELGLFATLVKHGLDPKRDVTIVPEALDMDLFLQHKVDAAAAMTYNELAQVLEAINPTTGKPYESSELNIIDFNKEGTAMLEDRLIVTEDWIKSARNQDIAVRFLRASIKGWIYCRDHPEDALEIVLKNAPTLGRSHQAWQLNEVNRLIWPSPHGIGMMDAQRWLETAKISHRYGVTKSLADRSAYTNEFVRKALDSLKNVDSKGLGWKPKVVTLVGRSQ
jgi:NitT/TauT family transport system substrate-binding protein